MGPLKGKDMGYRTGVGVTCLLRKAQDYMNNYNQTGFSTKSPRAASILSAYSYEEKYVTAVRQPLKGGESKNGRPFVHDYLL